ncbi:MAG: ABC transporter substrate-binding protein, partial [Burkholderiaceae bacterium]
MAFEGEPDGFDMVHTANGYSLWICEAIFETLLTYDYMARPAKLVPGTAEVMPEVSDGGKTYLFHIRKGIYFTPDPAFKGVRRELTAQDYAYSIKRLMDPQNRSPSAYFV